jgi:hypothetical protein
VQKHLLIRSLRQQGAGRSERQEYAHGNQECIPRKIHIDWALRNFLTAKQIIA